MSDRMTGTTPVGGDRDERTQRQQRRERSARVVAVSTATWTAAPDHPVEYRHLRGFGITRVAGGGIAAAASIVCLSYGVYGWAAFFGVLAAANLAGGGWYISIARSI
jgi:hypothetical protein